MLSWAAAPDLGPDLFLLLAEVENRKLSRLRPSLRPRRVRINRRGPRRLASRRGLRLCYVDTAPLRTPAG